MPTRTPDEVFQANRTEWIKEGHEGQWVVILGSRVIGFFADFNSAANAAVEDGSSQERLIKPVLKDDEVGKVQRVFMSTRAAI